MLSATPFVPSSSEFDQLQRKVTVVPNPFKFDGAHSYGGATIRFALSGSF